MDSENSTAFYLPAVAPEPDFSRIGEVVSDLLDYHGVVPIPDTYSQ
jgi:hypothetical protein